MTYRLRVDHAIAVIRAAVDPLHCEACVYEYETRIRFHVYDPDGVPIYSALSVCVADVIDRARLETIIEEVRTSLEQKGWKLNR